ncbi:hypothetical protein GMOD_00002333 [Pyrenophora seminiperda CCB06]|uniref:Uncharacterized protein n=1 Tax=Pyrenophora seminiperda CCB06 TaxID=1302712 RepID=A0A3M7LXJ8_9PLEO|nr:hypothetical protein GMOD_00002333 [Pyrenophora seminiperda CCB06]
MVSECKSASRGPDLTGQRPGLWLLVSSRSVSLQNTPLLSLRAVVPNQTKAKVEGLLQSGRDQPTFEMPTTDDPYVYGRSGSGENRGYDPSQRNVQRVSNIAYGRTSAFTYDVTTLASQEFAETHWPPSVYQAAQYPFSIPLTLRQRCTEVTQPDPSIEESWQASHTVTPLSYHGRSRNVTLPQTIDSQELYSQTPYTMTGYTNTSSQHPPLDANAFTEMAEDRYSPESPRPRSSGASRTNPERLCIAPSVRMLPSQDIARGVTTIATWNATRTGMRRAFAVANRNAQRRLVAETLYLSIFDEAIQNWMFRQRRSENK